MAYNTLTDLLSAIANAIRSKTGETNQINAQDFPSKISGITTASGNAQPSEVLIGKTFINSDGEQIGTMANHGAWSTTISSNSSIAIPKGYHNGNGNVSNTLKTQTLSGNVSVPKYNGTSVTWTANNMTKILGVTNIYMRQTHWGFVLGHFNAGGSNNNVYSINGNKITIYACGYVDINNAGSTETQFISCDVIGE